MSLTEIPENDVDILEPIPLVEKEKTPVFHDEGKFTVIEGSDVESGTYTIDTRIVKQLLDDEEWETLLKLKSDNKIIDTNAEDDYAIPAAYKDEGEVYRLWNKSEDPKGEKAKQAHEISENKYTSRHHI